MKKTSYDLERAHSLEASNYDLERAPSSEASNYDLERSPEELYSWFQTQAYILQIILGIYRFPFSEMSISILTKRESYLFFPM